MGNRTNRRSYNDTRDTYTNYTRDRAISTEQRSYKTRLVLKPRFDEQRQLNNESKTN